MDSSLELAKQSLEEQLSTKRPFYPLLQAAEESDEVQELWQYLLEKEDEDALVQLVHQVQRSPAIPRTRQKIGEYSWTARRIARDLPQSQNRNHLEYLAQALAKAGANVNAVDKTGVSPLMLASRNGHADVVQALITNGANVRLSDRSA